MLKSKCNKGFSIIEVILAFALFAVVSVPLFTTFAGAAKLLQSSKNNIELNSIVRLVRADINAAVYDDEKIYSFNGTGLNKVNRIPLVPGQTIKDYGILNSEGSAIDKTYKYSITHLNLATTGDVIYKKDEFNTDPGIRLRVDVYKLKSIDLNPSIDANFNKVRSFYLDTGK
jgi:type II secretory pathway pseudopilin PulG